MQSFTRPGVAMTLLACVLECSSIGAMIFLSIFVSTTRIGTNKDLEDDKKDDNPSPESNPTGPGITQDTTTSS